MSHDDGHRRMDAARIRAELTVQDLWLRYLGLGGNNDAFDIDGYLQGLVPMDSFQRSVLAQALNEALADSYEAYSIPLTGPDEADGSEDPHLRDLVRQLLDQLTPNSEAGQPSQEHPRPKTINGHIK